MGRHRAIAAASPVVLTLMLWSLWLSPITRGASRTDSRVFVRPADFDFSVLLGDPPADGSPQQRAEISQILHLQNRRTAEEVIRCQEEANHLSVWLFATVLGDDFEPTSHPLTAALFQEVRENAEPVVQAAKRQWARPRPYRVDPEIDPCVHMEKNASYPSAHAMFATLWGTILSNVYPEKRDALMARARMIGNDRVIAGVHYPSDVAAGQKLGADIANRLLANRDFQIELRSVRAECGQSSPAPATAPSLYGQ